MGIRPLVLLVPSMAAAVELPRRVASTGRPLAGVYPFKLRDLARTLAEPALLGAGLRSWDAGHDALVAARLLEEGGADALSVSPDLPRGPIAAALARTLTSLRLAGVEPARVAALADHAGTLPEDQQRLRAVAEIFRRFVEAVEGRFADPATLLRAAREHLDQAWLRDADVLVADDLELEAEEQEFLRALARTVPVRRLARAQPPGLQAGSFAAWSEGAPIPAVAPADTALAPLFIAAHDPPAGLRRLRETLFEPGVGEAARDGSVELVTAPGENAEVRAVVRRLLAHAARGVPWEEMAVILPRPREYAFLFTDLLRRLDIPHRLHPSLPLSSGRSARSLLLLLRCRSLPRAAVMEFLTFAPVPFHELLGEGAAPVVSRWDALSRDAGIVSGLERWIIGLRAGAEKERVGAEAEEEPRRASRLRRAAEAESLLRVVELLSVTLDGLSGDAPWPEWSARLSAAFSNWVRGDPGRLEHQAVAGVLADLASLGFLQPRAPWPDVQSVLEARLEWERMPLEPHPEGALHVGSLDAMAGVPFRVVAVPGLVEGGFPGVIRPDPFLLDAEREALAAPTPVEGPPKARQLSLFDPPERARPPAPPTSQDRVLEARRAFHRALGQATESLVLSYPRADPRTGRERMPSLFFVAAAAAREGRPLSAAELDALVAEDALDALLPEQALDRSERDRIRVRAGGREAALAIAAGSVFFKQSHLASEARWSNRLTAYDGLVTPLPADLARKLDPVTSDRPVSASKLATWSRCGFQYLLQYVLGLTPALEPEERKRLDPLERGNAFHLAAERFLRESRERGLLPVRATPETQQRLIAHADRALDELVASSPPRFTVLWERERERFRKGMLAWLAREVDGAHRATPAWFEVSFGLSRDRAPGEPHLLEPLEVDLGDGRSLRVSGKIDRIDRRPDGTLVLRDYKTGRAPRDDGSVFRGGKQLQIPFYVLAAARMFPDEPVVEAFLDYVDGGRQVAFDPAEAHGEAWKARLRGMVDAIGQGVFAQEHTSCDWCDYTSVCGPKGLLERRRRYKVSDPRLVRVLRLRDAG
ncbi:MAG TPA: PD-(D/E)XK nuclease family protein [Vicinamibacteria bacterium]|nr:PD-(D/E)XK nuclease family protein [Vicinamibacteria bacterium]